MVLPGQSMFLLMRLGARTGAASGEALRFATGRLATFRNWDLETCLNPDYLSANPRALTNPDTDLFAIANSHADDPVADHFCRDESSADLLS